jgi:hypothetical protein
MRRMFLVISVFTVATLLTLSAAQAQTGMASGASSVRGRGLGLGAVAMLNGTSGGLVTYGSWGGRFHIDGLAGLRRFNDGGDVVADFTLGGRFWYHLHSTAFSDFSIGGGLGFIYYDGRGGGDSQIDVTMEVGGQIRAFIVPNVALLADVGFGAYFGNDDDILIGGQNIGGGNFVHGTLGIAYFFE